MTSNPKGENSDSSDLPGVAAVNRALAILCAFGSGDNRLSLAELSRRTGLYKSTILRLAESLEAFAFLKRDKGGDFRLGVEILRLGSLARLHVGGSEDILSILKDMMERTGESATYYVRRGQMRLALYRVDSPKSVRDHIREGDLLPLGLGAAGRVLRSALERSRSRSGDERSFDTIVSLGERDPEVAAVAGPVYSANRLAGALSVSGPISRFTPASVRSMATVVEENCRRLSALL